MARNNICEDTLFFEVYKALNSVNIIYSGKKDDSPGYKLTREEIKCALMTFPDYIDRFDYFPENTLFAVIFLKILFTLFPLSSLSPPKVKDV